MPTPALLPFENASDLSKLAPAEAAETDKDVKMIAYIVDFMVSPFIGTIKNFSGSYFPIATLQRAFMLQLLRHRIIK
jgi:hypothetical protein